MSRPLSPVVTPVPSEVLNDPHDSTTGHHLRRGRGMRCCKRSVEMCGSTIASCDGYFTRLLSSVSDVGLFWPSLMQSRTSILARTGSLYLERSPEARKATMARRCAFACLTSSPIYQTANKSHICVAYLLVRLIKTYYDVSSMLTQD